MLNQKIESLFPVCKFIIGPFYSLTLSQKITFLSKKFSVLIYNAETNAKPCEMESNN